MKTTILDSKFREPKPSAKAPFPGRKTVVELVLTALIVVMLLAEFMRVLFGLRFLDGLLNPSDQKWLDWSLLTVALYALAMQIDWRNEESMESLPAGMLAGTTALLLVTELADFLSW